MALIKCPECGKQISDRAEVCPHCGIEVQRVLAEIREKEKQQQEERRQSRKKRRKHIIISTVSVCVVAIIAVSAYLYSIDALNTIPAEYRKQTEGYFKSYEINLDKGDFDRANGHLNTLKNRRLTNREAKRLEESKKTLVDTMLNDLENSLASITNNYDSKKMECAKQKMVVLNSCQLDAFQTERLQKAKEKYVEFQLEEMEKRVKLHESDSKGFYSFYTTEQLALDLQDMELSTAQKTRLEELNKDIYRIKNQKEEERYKQLLKTIRDEYIELLSINKLSDDGYDEGYFLHDIDNDGIPEIWIKSGTCRADTRMLVYQYNNGIRKIYDAGAGSFYIGEGYVLDVYAQMGYATWEKLTYNGSSITSTVIYEEDINGTNRDYRDPEEKYIGFYSLNNKQPILNAFKAGL